MKSAVRPLITFLFTLAQAGLGVGWVFDIGAEAPFVALAPFTMFTLVYWFEKRSQDKNHV